MTERIGLEILGPEGELFVIEEFVGRGSFGNVYRAVGKENKQVVALKMLPSAEAENPSTLQVRSLTNEAKHALLKIRHPNVVSYLFIDKGTDASIGPYLMLEFIDGGTLFNILQEKRQIGQLIQLDTAIDLMRQIALGSQTVNDYVVHRDIKPDNILTTGSDKLLLKIADFGISKAISEATRTETFKGIQHAFYIAPEVIQGENNTYKIDVYSVGLIFYEILSLKHPLYDGISDHSNQFEWFNAHQHNLPPDIRTLRSEVPFHLAKLLLRMTDKSPDSRPDWEQVLATLNLDQPVASPLVAIDHSLIEIMEHHVEKELKIEQEQKAKQLREKLENERHRRTIDEIAKRQETIFGQFDDVIETLNSQVAGYKVAIQREELTRKYTLPTGKTFDMSLSQPSWIHVIFGEHERIQSIGYMGTPGGFSANIVLIGPKDNIASCTWHAVGARINGIIGSEGRLKAYQDAGADDKIIRYMEYQDGNEMWRRDAPSYFGFRNYSRFVEAYPSRGLGLYNFQTLDLLQSFNDVIKVTMQMP